MDEQKSVSKEGIISAFMAYTEQHQKRPKTLNDISSFLTIEIAEIEAHYTAIFAIEKSIYNEFFIQTIITLETDEGYAEYDARLKLLSFYYTLFENLTLNEDLFKVIFKNSLGKLAALSTMSDLERSFKNYITHLQVDYIDLQVPVLNEWQQKGMQELAWGQLLLTIQFWSNDTSENKERTDVLIEKSVNTSFNLLDNTALKSALDLGKFIFQENVKK